MVFDDHHQPIVGVLIRAEVLNNGWWFQEQTLTDSQGNYHFENAPAGMQMVIVASKVGFTTRKRVEVLSENRAGNPNVNRYDFGTNGGFETFSRAYDALSDKPEVIWVEPRRNDSQVNPQTEFVLKFSEPMDTQSVEECFALFSFLKRKLSVDSENSQRAYTLLGNGLIANNFQPPNSTRIWDKTAFQIRWDSTHTEMTLRFLPGKSLPTDRSIDRAPDYNLAFFANGSGNRVIKDANGTARAEKHFKLTDGNFEESFKFSILPDLTPPTLESAQWAGITPQTASILLKYSEPMLLATHSLNIAGGMTDTLASCTMAPAGFPGAKTCTPSQAAQNYTLTVKTADGQIKYQRSWAQLGGEARYDPDDPSFRRVLLSASALPFLQAVGDIYEVQALPQVSDPAGNLYMGKPVSWDSPNLPQKGA